MTPAADRLHDDRLLSRFFSLVFFLFPCSRISMFISAFRSAFHVYFGIICTVNKCPILSLSLSLIYFPSERRCDSTSRWSLTVNDERSSTRKYVHGARRKVTADSVRADCMTRRRRQMKKKRGIGRNVTEDRQIGWRDEGTRSGWRRGKMKERARVRMGGTVGRKGEQNGETHRHTQT